MVTVFLLGYVGLVVLAFKVFKIKTKPVSLTAAGFIGVLLPGGMLVAWKCSAPLTAQMVLHRKIRNLIGNHASKQLAKLNLSQNVTRPPSDGYLVNLQTTEGTTTTTWIKQSQGLFLNTKIPAVVVAVYPRNLVKNDKSDDAVAIGDSARR